MANTFFASAADTAGSIDPSLWRVATAQCTPLAVSATLSVKRGSGEGPVQQQETWFAHCLGVAVSYTADYYWDPR